MNGLDYLESPQGPECDCAHRFVGYSGLPLHTGRVWRKECGCLCKDQI